MPLLTPDGSGKPQINPTDDTTLNLHPQEVRKDTTKNKRYPGKTTQVKFKLVTVRRLTNYTAEDLTLKLAESYKQLEAAALRTGQPVPYPNTPGAVDATNAYGVFIDEDLADNKALPIYTFLAASPKVKCFITANGAGKNDWSVHIAHALEKTVKPDNTFITKWRIVCIDSTGNGRTYHTLEDSGLPEAYRSNFDVDALNYLGGGTWTGMAVDRADRLPIYAIAAADNDRYIKVGKVYRGFGESRVKSLVAYSMTPTYVFTWQRGELELHRRQREASQTLDKAKLSSEGVISYTRQHTYTLDTHYRIENLSGNKDISAVVANEYSRGKATYVGNTNAPGVNSQYQSPDYGTDAQRLSVAEIEMSTNIVRPTQFEYTNQLPDSKIALCSLSYAPVVCASHDMSFFLRYDFGEAKGRVKHPYEVRKTTGNRGFQYGETYKLWWGYGKVLETYEYGDTNRYRILRNPGFDANGVRLSDRVKIGSMFDLGKLQISSQFPNAVETTWDSLANPPTGYFGIEQGSLSFWVVYLNPPIIGHTGVYYYHINPPVVGADSGAYELDGFNNDARYAQNVLKNVYSQMLGALGGGGLTSLDIGNVTIAANDRESLIVREPNTTQKAALLEYPETFPAGYFDANIYEFTLNNDNQGQITAYNRDGTVIQTYNIT